MGPDPKPVRPELVEGPSFSSRKEKEKNSASTSSARTEFGQALTGSPSINRFAKNSLNSRSEEHTSELQSLMRISYAVFCLKKKTTNPTYTQNITLSNTHKTNQYTYK